MGAQETVERKKVTREDSAEMAAADATRQEIEREKQRLLKEHGEQLEAEADSLLDEIDELLQVESTFLTQYRQKGGE